MRIYAGSHQSGTGQDYPLSPCVSLGPHAKALPQKPEVTVENPWVAAGPAIAEPFGGVGLAMTPWVVKREKLRVNRHSGGRKVISAASARPCVHPDGHEWRNHGMHPSGKFRYWCRRQHNGKQCNAHSVGDARLPGGGKGRAMLPDRPCIHPDGHRFTQHGQHPNGAKREICRRKVDGKECGKSRTVKEQE